MGVKRRIPCSSSSSRSTSEQLCAALLNLARRERSLPVVEEFFEWLGTELADLTILPSSPFSKAASYALERKYSLSVYLSDPAVPIDTNHLERALRPIPMGRKNWLFCWTEVGAEHVGKIQSLIVTCRLQGINP